MVENKNGALTTILKEDDKLRFADRLSRFVYLDSIEPMEGYPMHHLTKIYVDEAKRCWIEGAYLPCILMVTLAFEEQLRGHYRVIGGSTCKQGFTHIKKVDDATFHQLAEEALLDALITQDEKLRIDKLRKEFRNEYVHTKEDIPTKIGAPKKSSWFTQSIKMSAPAFGELTFGSSIISEAKESVEILLTIMPRLCHRCFPV
jgi:hypothetical protein